MLRCSNLSLSAQTAYAELFSQTQAFELDNALGGLVGAFHKRKLKAREYWYFAYRDMDQKLRMVYVGPDNERVRLLVGRFGEARQSRPLVSPARMPFLLWETCSAFAGMMAQRRWMSILPMPGKMFPWRCQPASGSTCMVPWSR